MSAHRSRQADLPDHKIGLSYYPAPLPAGPSVIPLFWLAVVLLAALMWWLS